MVLRYVRRHFKPLLGIKGLWTFRHTPLAMYWAKLALKDMLVETVLKDENLPPDVTNAHWIAHVVSYAGYLAKIRYEGYDTNDDSKTHWVHFCKDLYRIGYCADNHLPIVPPLNVIQQKQEWREWIIKRVTGGYTMHALTQQLIAYDNDTQLRKGTEVEVLDKFSISRMRVGYVKEVIGHRVHVRYWDTDADDQDLSNSFWCHEQSDAINVVGWSKTVGHAISAPAGYDPAEIGNSSVIKKNPGVNIQVGMKLEAVDPLKLSAISAATVVKVLKHGYLMVHIDSAGHALTQTYRGVESDANHGNNRFCYHVTSPLIFPCGFCKENNIELQPPIEFKTDNFDWNEYFKATGAKPLPLKDLEKEVIDHGFTEGAKLEAVDVMEPNLICVATVKRVIGRLLRIGFDGWEDNYDQWADATSCDLFPIGWCQLMNYDLQPPHVENQEPGLKPVSPGVKRIKSKSGTASRSKRQSATSSSD
ncbi:unnamed protein product [Allacma fusca]|uniref:Uncharacterized protein n=1 Tax=Allacma fusca TaxID=39272 RepID=A0A8J2LDE9_9HEXA|nr:unnamed protein product [Allacma fusca]